MSLSQAYEDLTKSETSHRTCKTCRWWFELEEEDQRFFDAKVSDPSTNITVLLKACTTQGGLDVSRSSFRNHIAEHHPKLVMS